MSDKSLEEIRESVAGAAKVLGLDAMRVFPVEDAALLSLLRSPETQEALRTSYEYWGNEYGDWMSFSRRHKLTEAAKEEMKEAERLANVLFKLLLPDGGENE